MLPLLTPGYLMFFVNIGPNLGQQRENGANQNICQTWVSISHCFHLSLLKSTLPRLHTSTTRSFNSLLLSSSTITPSSSVRNLGVIFNDQLTFKDHIAKTARSCRFALHNIRKIRPFLTEHAAQLLVQTLVISSWTTAMLFWLDFHQTQSNLYKWFRMQRHDCLQRTQKAHVHLSLSPCTGSRLQLASGSRHWCLHIKQPQAQHSPTSTHWWQSTSPSRSLRSASKRRLVVLSQRCTKSL